MQSSPINLFCTSVDGFEKLIPNQTGVGQELQLTLVVGRVIGFDLFIMSTIQQGILAISHEPANHPIIRKFFRFAAAVALVPIAVYIVVSQLVRTVTATKTGFLSPPILGGLAAILSLNIVMGMFAVSALKEEPPVQGTDSAGSEIEAEVPEDDDSSVRPGEDNTHDKTE